MSDTDMTPRYEVYVAFADGVRVSLQCFENRHGECPGTVPSDSGSVDGWNCECPGCPAHAGPVGAGPRPAKTAGQASYEARIASFRRRHGSGDGQPPPGLAWIDLTDEQRSDEEAGARAAAAARGRAQHAAAEHARLREQIRVPEVRLSAIGGAGEPQKDSDSADPRWEDLCPAGRQIFYEGDDPAGFCAEIRGEFGFDPAADPGWDVPAGEEPGDSFRSCSFFCPPEHLDAIYGSSRWPLGS